MRVWTWVFAVLLALAPVSSALAQSTGSKPATTRKKKPRRAKPKPKPAPAPVAAPVAEPGTDAPVAQEQADDDSGPQWETEEDEQEKADAAKVAERARAAATKKQAAEAEQLRIEEAVKWRRTMLTVHQGLGIATWLGLVGTTVIGQLEINDKYRTGSVNPDRFERLHFGLAIGSTGLFTATGLMGLLAPRAYHTKPGFSTVTLHRILLGIATAGMLAQVGLGLYANAREGSLDQRVVVQAHQIIGYGTLGALTVGAAVLFF